MTSQRTTRSSGGHRLLPLLVVALAVAGCGGQLTDAQVLKANGVRAGVSAGGADSAAAAPGDVAPGSAAGSGLGSSPGAAGGTVTRGTGAGGAPGAPNPSAAGKGASNASTPGVGTPGETGPIIIGNVGTYSGPAGSSTSGIPRAVQVWAASVNQRGGLFGRTVQVIVQDDGGDPARFASAVQDLVENRHVIAFVGESSLGIQGGAGYLKSKGIPVIGTDCSTSAWYQSSDFFPQCASITPATAGLGLKAVVHLTGDRKLGIVYCTETSVCSDGKNTLVQGAALQGVDVVYDASVSIAQVDFTANCQAAQSKGAQMFTVIGDANTVARFSQSCVRQNFRPQYVQPSITTKSDTTSTPGLEKVILPLQTFPFAGLTSPAFTEFAQAMSTFAPNEIVGPASSYGWSSAKLFELAANRAAAATHSLNPKSLVDAMHTVKGETLGGLTVSLDFTGATPNNAPCGFVIQANGSGKWTLPVGPGPYC